MGKMKKYMWHILCALTLVLLFVRYSVDLHQDGVNDGRREYAAQLGQLEMERDLLSDAIRNIYDNSDSKNQQQQKDILNYYLGIFNCSFDSLGSWSYCY